MAAARGHAGWRDRIRRGALSPRRVAVSPRSVALSARLLAAALAMALLCHVAAADVIFRVPDVQVICDLCDILFGTVSYPVFNSQLLLIFEVLTLKNCFLFCRRHGVIIMHQHFMTL